MKTNEVVSITADIFGFQNSELISLACLTSSDLEAEFSPLQISKISQALEAEFETKALPLEYMLSKLDIIHSPAVRAFKTSQNLLSGLKRMVLLKVLEYPVNAQFNSNDECPFLSIKLKDKHESSSFFYILELLVLTKLFRTSTKNNLVPNMIYTPGTHPHILEQIENHLNLQIQMGDSLRILFSKEQLNLPILHQAQHKQPSLDKIEPIFLGKEVKALIQEILPSGDHQIEIIANKLATSPRTLQRRLQEQNLNYKNLVNETRFETAKALLRENQYHMKEIAHLVGYAELSPFYRAFKKFSGQTPVEYIKLNA